LLPVINFHRCYEEVKTAKKILIVGGGPVGVEIAGEILSKYPKKNVTLVTSASTLLSRLSPKAQKLAESKLKSLGVNIIYNETVVTTTEDQKTFVTSKGTSIEADLVMRLIGITPNSSFMRSKFSEKLDERGFIKVNEHLQLEGQKNIFVIGDVTAIKEEKCAINVKNHLDVVATNLRNIVEEKPLKQYVTGPLMMLVSVGPSNGVLENNGKAMGFPGSALGWLKRSAFKSGMHSKVGCTHDSNEKCFACKMLAQKKKE
jgi:NADH dehydrogenase FAD-containing subunit